MEYLKKYPDMTILRVSMLSNISASVLRDEQLAFLRSNLKRDSKLWDTQGYGK